jgi:hypothetical protein
MDYTSYQSNVARMGEMRDAYRVLVENLMKEATWKT